MTMDKVERWLSSYGPKGTRKKYRRALTKFCNLYEATPEETLTWDLDVIEDRMVDWKVAQRNADYAGATILTDFAAVKRWFIFNRKRIIAECKNISTTKKTLDYLPRRADVQTLLDSAKLSHRVAISLFGFSGLRPIDQSELVYENVKASLEDGDEVLTIIKQHRKTRQWYVTFLGPQGTGYLRRYLDARRKKGEVITDKTPILIGLKGQSMKSDSISQAIGRIIKATVGKYPTGESFRRFRPYGLRKYFRRAMRQLGESMAEYLMGHREGLEGMPATYGGLRDLDPVAIAFLKKDYISVLSELETEVTDTTLRVKIEKMEEEKGTLKERMDLIAAEHNEIRELLQQLKKQDEG